MSSGKLGTFGGVFTPSLLTILGVLMYLRLPWVVGNAGLYGALGILLAAHVVSIATGLSVSSIATDKKVGTGGSFYILSRSFGLPIGGAIGLALFVGMSFAISLHVVGFSESVLDSLGYERTATGIRVCGTITLLAVASTVLVSTSLAIRTQYLIMFLVAASLVSIFLGNAHTASPQLAKPGGGMSFALMFGIFFPAVTGLTAGVEMSIDLRDPKRSLPRGTMAAIIVAFLIYLALMVFCALRVDAAMLRDDPQVLQHVALWEPAVLAGLWGASLSSALGAILCAPRILQAMSIDHITPRVFGAGRGATNEPRNALVLAFAIGEAGVLIADLDVVARVVSTVFLALYGSINVTCAIESWANPDFRPRFKIPKLVSIVGAVAALVLMIQLDPLATLGATALLLGLYGALKRRQLRLEGGGTWRGIWSTVVRTGLGRLQRASDDPRSWRPNVLLFDDAEHPLHPAIREFASTLASGNGMVTDFHLAAPGAADEVPADPATAVRGVFDTRVVTGKPMETVAALCQYHGFTGIPPNTLLLPWRQHGADPDGFVRALHSAADRGLSILLFDRPRTATRNARPRVDVWWAPEAGNLAFSVALMRFITRAPEWERAEVGVVLVGDGSDHDHLLRARAARFLDGARVEATVRVIVRPRGTSLHELVCNESRPADLTLLGLRADLSAVDPTSLHSYEQVASLPGCVVFLRASSSFHDVLAARAPHADAGRPDAHPGVEEVEPELALPSHPDLAATVTAIAEHTRARLAAIHDKFVAISVPYVELCSSARALIEKRADALIEAARELDPARRRKLANRATGAYFTAAVEALGHVEDDEVAGHAAMLADQLAAVRREGSALPASVPRVVRIERARSELVPLADDDPQVRRWKRRQLVRTFYRRRVTQKIAVGMLAERAHDRIMRAEVTEAIARFRTASHDLVVEVGRALAATEWRAHADIARADLRDTDALVARIKQSRDAALRRLSAVGEHTRQRLAEHRLTLDAAALAAVRQLAADLDRPHAPLIARAASARRREDVAAIAALPSAADAWRDGQIELLRRIRTAVQLGKIHDALTSLAARHLDEILGGIRASGVDACLEVRAAVERHVQFHALAADREAALRAAAERASPAAVGNGDTAAPRSKPPPLPRARRSRGQASPVADDGTLATQSDTLAGRQLAAMSAATRVAAKMLARASSPHIAATPAPATVPPPLAEPGVLPDVREEQPYDPSEALDRFSRAAAAVTSTLPEHVTLLTDEAAAALVRGDAAHDTVLVPVRSAVQGVVEGDLIAPLGALAHSFGDAVGRAWSVAREAVGLLQLRGNGGPDDLGEAANHAREAREWLDAAIAKVREAEGDIERAITGGLDALATATALDGLCASLEARGGATRDADKPSRLGAALRRSVAGVRDLAARAVYRRSAGLVFAREVAASRERALGHAVRDLIAASTPARAVLEALPHYYRNLFIGQIPINDTFFVGHAPQVRAGVAALAGERAGLRSVLVTGSRGAGKTTLCQLIARAAGGEVTWVAPPVDGAATRAAMRTAIESALGVPGEPTQLVGRLPAGSVLVFDDLDLWWERRAGGLDAIDELLALVAETGDRIGYILAGGARSLRLLGALRPLTSTARDHVVCRPLTARELERVILARHESTGLGLRLRTRGKRGDRALGPWTRARLFDAHFVRSSGNVGSALRAWIAHVDAVTSERLTIRMPRPLDWGPLDDLPPHLVAVLLEVLLHKAASADKLARVTGGTSAELRAALGELLAMGLVVQNRRQIAAIDPAVYEPLIAWLGKRELA